MRAKLTFNPLLVATIFSLCRGGRKVINVGVILVTGGWLEPEGKSLFAMSLESMLNSLSCIAGPEISLSSAFREFRDRSLLAWLQFRNYDKGINFR